MKTYCAYEIDPTTKLRYWFPKCQGGAALGMTGCTCKRPRRSGRLADPLAMIPTQALLKSLAARHGVTEHYVQVAEPYHIVIGGGREQGLGSARIFVVPTGESA